MRNLFIINKIKWIFSKSKMKVALFVKYHWV